MPRTFELCNKVKNATNDMMIGTSRENMELAKRRAHLAVAESQALEREYQIAVQSIQNGIRNRLELAKLWKVTNRDDPIFVKINELMMKEETLTTQLISAHVTLRKHRRDYAKVCENVLVTFNEDMRNQKETKDDNQKIHELSQTSETLSDEYKHSAQMYDLRSFVGPPPGDWRDNIGSEDDE